MAEVDHKLLGTLSFEIEKLSHFDTDSIRQIIASVHSFHATDKTSKIISGNPLVQESCGALIWSKGLEIMNDCLAMGLCCKDTPFNVLLSDELRRRAKSNSSLPPVLFHSPKSSFSRQNLVVMPSSYAEGLLLLQMCYRQLTERSVPCPTGVLPRTIAT